MIHYRKTLTVLYTVAYIAAAVALALDMFVWRAV
jgi:hypothetical protein